MLLQLHEVSAGKLESVRAIGAFPGLPGRQIELLARSLDEVEVEAGSTLIEEGRRNRAFWALLEGEVGVGFGGERLRRLGPGSGFGAMSMLDGLDAQATVVSWTALRALVAGPEQFRALAGSGRWRCASRGSRLNACARTSSR